MVNNNLTNSTCFTHILAPGILYVWGLLFPQNSGTDVTGRPGYRTMEVPHRTSLVPLASPYFLLCLIGVETEGLVDYQGRAGIISIVLWNLPPVIFGVENAGKGLHEEFRGVLEAPKFFVLNFFACFFLHPTRVRIFISRNSTTGSYEVEAE